MIKKVLIFFILTILLSFSFSNNASAELRTLNIIDYPVRYVGDSIARMYAGFNDRGNDDSDSKVGRQPEAILKHIKKNPAKPGQKIIVSTGIINSLGTRLHVVENIIKTLKEQEADIELLGTSNIGKHNHNKFLQKLADTYDIKFIGAYIPSGDTVHPKPSEIKRMKNEKR